MSQLPAESFDDRAGSLAYFSAFESRYSGVIMADMRLDNGYLDLIVY